MLTSKSDDNWMAACNIIHVLAVHDDAMRARLAEHAALVPAILKIARTRSCARPARPPARPPRLAPPGYKNGPAARASGRCSRRRCRRRRRRA